MASYDIIITGARDPLRVDRGVEPLIERWQLYRLKKIADEPAKIAGWVGMLSSIKGFRPTDQVRAASGDGGRATENEYRRQLDRMRNLQPAERANHLGFFRLIWWGFTGKRSDGTGVERQARDIQQQFFAQHPKRTFCDPQLFRPIIPGVSCHPSVVSIIERQIQQDKYAERFIKVTT